MYMHDRGQLQIFNHQTKWTIHMVLSAEKIFFVQNIASTDHRCQPQTDQTDPYANRLRSVQTQNNAKYGMPNHTKGDE